MSHSPVSHRHRWAILYLGVLAQASTCVFLYGLPMLVPTLRTEEKLSLSQAGVVVAAPSVGLLLMLIVWGALADRFGERIVITSGMALAAVALVVAALARGLVPTCLALVAAGAAGASVNAASGRMVLGWFTARERGFAMGVRQTAQPLGVGIAALLLPSAAHHWGVHHTLFLPAALCGVFAVLIALVAVDPPRTPRAAGAAVPRSPYRTSVLWRVHAASAALVVPQFAVSGFTLAYLVSERDWNAVTAGRVIFAMQVAGAAGRIGAGVWSDRVASRLRPMRQLAGASALLMLAIAVGDLAHSWIVVVAFALGAIVTVADNGLAFTSVAELAGSSWAGRALGVQNTGQNVAAALTPPVLGALVGAHGYAPGFALAAAFPIAAIFLTPVVRAEGRPRTGGAGAHHAVTIAQDRLDSAPR